MIGLGFIDIILCGRSWGKGWWTGSKHCKNVDWFRRWLLKCLCFKLAEKIIFWVTNGIAVYYLRSGEGIMTWRIIKFSMRGTLIFFLRVLHDYIFV
jgi:hypothetical protein